MIGHSEMKRGSGLSEWSGKVWRHTGMWLWLRSGPRGSTELQVGWEGEQVGPCNWRRGTWKKIHRYGGVQFGWQSFQQHDYTIYHYYIFFWISQPMHGFSLWRQQNERKKIIKKKKQQMYNWSFVRLPYCVFLSDISWCVWDSSIFLFAFCVCPLKLTEASCIKGDERSCSNCVGLGVLLGWGSVVVLWIVLAREKDLLVSTVCS